MSEECVGRSIRPKAAPKSLRNLLRGPTAAKAAPPAVPSASPLAESPVARSGACAVVSTPPVAKVLPVPPAPVATSPERVAKKRARGMIAEVSLSADEDESDLGSDGRLDVQHSSSSPERERSPSPPIENEPAQASSADTSVVPEIEVAATMPPCAHSKDTTESAAPEVVGSCARPSAVDRHAPKAASCSSPIPAKARPTRRVAPRVQPPTVTAKAKFTPAPKKAAAQDQRARPEFSTQDGVPLGKRLADEFMQCFHDVSSDINGIEGNQSRNQRGNGEEDLDDYTIRKALQRRYRQYRPHIPGAAHSAKISGTSSELVIDLCADDDD